MASDYDIGKPVEDSTTTTPTATPVADANDASTTTPTPTPTPTTPTAPIATSPIGGDGVYQPYQYQPIGAENLANQQAYYNNIGITGAYNPSGAPNSNIQPINPFTAASQPVGTTGLPVYPGMPYGPGTAPIPGQVVPGGVTAGLAQPTVPAIPGDPAQKGKIKQDEDGKYSQPTAPTVQAPMISSLVCTH